MKQLSLVAMMLLMACDEPRPADTLSEKDFREVRSVIEAYAEAWKAGDPAGVLRLFAEDAVISPSGSAPREGVQALRAFWFPNDSSVTTIHSYDIDVLDAGGSGDMAFTYEKGSLSFTYSRGDIVMSRDSKAYATTLYRRDSLGSWRITRRMWTDLRIEP